MAGGGVEVNVWHEAYGLAEQEGETRDIVAEWVGGLAGADRDDCLEDLMVRQVDRCRRDVVRAIEQGADIAQRVADDSEELERIEALVRRRDELQRLVDAGDLPLEAAVGEIEQALRTGTFVDGRTRAGRLRAKVYIVERLERQLEVPDADGHMPSALPYVREIKHTSVADIPFWRKHYEWRLDQQVQREAERLARRRAAGLKSFGTWEDDLAFITDLRLRMTFDPTPALLNAKFAVGGRAVTWGEASVADHWARIDEQTTHAAGTMEDAQRHLEAAELIESLGLACLNDLGSLPSRVAA